MFSEEKYLLKGSQLTEVAFPLGGIGSGCISLEGRGALRDWEIFGRPNKQTLAENTFPLLWCRQGDGKPDVRVVQGPRLKEFLGLGDSYGTGHLYQGDGMPCFSQAECVARFPSMEVRLQQPGHPLEVSLTAFSPFFPHDDRSASLPIGVLNYRLKNRSDQPVSAVLAWNVMNPVGWSEKDAKPEDDKARATSFREGGVTGFQFSNEKYSADSIHRGTFAVSTDWPEASICERWYEGSWFDALQDFWNRFSVDGGLNEAVSDKAGYRMPATLALKAEIQPGEEVVLPFCLSWVFPNADRYWDTKFEPEAGIWTRYYATQWPEAKDAAAEFFARKDELTDSTFAFEEALFGSDLPSEVIASAGYTASILRSPTIERLTDGTLWAWEGCNEKSGSCHGSCSHVWNYAVTHAVLFPKLYETMLTSSFEHGFKCGPPGDTGAMNFRLMLPLAHGSPLWHAAIDGQLGLVIQLYRSWKWSDDRSLLEKHWKDAKRALEFAWVQWDRDRDGLVDGDMHNTYDINFQGPNPLGQFFYLGALRAGEEMATEMGDPDAAEEYKRLYEAGTQKAMDVLWNGEYFEQRVEAFESDPPKYQHGIGCLSDQIFGVLCSKIAGLPDLLSEDVQKTTLDSIFRRCFRDPLGDHTNLQRSYAAHDEAGLILCSWPRGGRPEYPFVYSDEVWTGIEYQVATHLAYLGSTEEALSIIRAIRSRYDGVRRNPYNEVECGSHYARALAAWGLILAWPKTGGPRIWVGSDGWGS